MDESIAFLKKLDISFELIEHAAVYTIEEAMAEPTLQGRTEIKNLFIQDDKGKRFYLVVMPGLKKLDLKQLAVDLGEKKVRFCSTEKVERMLGVKPGSVSIFCCLYPQSREVMVIYDEELLEEKEIGFHPIVNTATIFMAPKSIHAILENIIQPSKILKL